MKKEFNLKKEREDLKKITLKNFKDFKRGNFIELFEAIENQDKEFIERLKEKWRGTIWFRAIEEDINRLT